MAEQVGSIYYKVSLDDKSFHSSAKRVQDSTGMLEKSWDNAVKSSKQLLLGVTALSAGIVAFGFSSVKAFQESESMIAQTNAVLKSTGQIAGVTGDQVTKLANSFQRSTAYSDEQVRSVENMALTFTSIHKDIFPRTVKAALGMATALNHGITPAGQEASDTMKLLGKAMQDPDAGLGALKRVGVNVDELRKKFEGINDVGVKQKLILQELSTEFGGSADAAAKTYAGRIQQIKNEFDDLQEQVGGMILDALKPLIDWFGRMIQKIKDAGGLMKVLGTFFEKNRTAILAVAGAIAVALIPAFISLAISIGSAILPLIPFLAIGAVLGIMFDDLVKKMGGWKVLWHDIKGSIEYLTNGGKWKEGMFADNIGKDSALIKFLDRLRDIIEDIKSKAETTYKAVKTLITGDAIAGELNSSKKQDKISQSKNGVVNRAAVAENNRAGVALDSGPSELQQRLLKIRKLIMDVSEAIWDVNSAILGLIKTMGGPFIKAFGWLYEMSRFNELIKEFGRAWRSVGDMLAKIPGAVMLLKIVLMALLAVAMIPIMMILAPFIMAFGALLAVLEAVRFVLWLIQGALGAVGNALKSVGGVIKDVFSGGWIKNMANLS